MESDRWVGECDRGRCNATLAGQRAPAIKPFGKPVAEYAEPFTQISGVRELADGRVLVLDMMDKAIQVVDAQFSAATRVGREGRGPGEYARPAQLIAAPGDSSLVYDVGAFRYLWIDQQGRPGGTLPLMIAGEAALTIPAVIRGIDAKGRLVFQTTGVTMKDGAPVFADSTPVVRRALTGGKLDTLAFVHTGSVSPRMSGSATSGLKISGTMPAFPTVDDWGMLPDGRVAIVRGKDYHVDLVAAPGSVAAAPPIAYERVKVVEADKERVREATRKSRDMANKAIADAMSSLPKGRTPPKMPTMTIDEPASWPAEKPAFGQGALLIAPNGRLWVRRHRAAADTLPLYDVLGVNGRVESRMTLPFKGRVVGFGRGWVYVVRIDADDLEYLQRHKM
ncbi:MAG: hypothetical protein U0163_21315 [Gemmatimonadaceae bacterium]